MTANCTEGNMKKNLVTLIKDAYLNKRRGSRKADLYEKTEIAQKTEHELRTEFRSGWITQKACTMKGLDGLKNWIDVDDEKVAERLKELKLHKALEEADRISNLYGGAAIFISVADTGDLSEPIGNIAKIRALNVVDKKRCYATEYETDLTKEGYHKPLFYFANGEKVHKDRIIPFVGAELDFETMQANQGYGDPIVTKMLEDIRRFGITLTGVEDIFIDYSTKVLSIENLFDLLKSEKKILEERLALVNELTSNDGLLVIQSGEEFKKVENRLAGIDKLLDFAIDVVAGATDIPRAKLLSQQLGTLAGAKEGTNDYIRKVEMYRESKFTPAIDRVVGLLNAELGTSAKWEWRPVETPTPQQRVETQNKAAVTVTSLFNAGLLTEEEARKPFNATTKEYTLQLEDDLNLPGDDETE